MSTIKYVRVAPSNIEGNGPGFAVMVDLYPADEHGRCKIAQAIRYALEGLNLDDTE